MCNIFYFQSWTISKVILFAGSGHLSLQCGDTCNVEIETTDQNERLRQKLALISNEDYIVGANSGDSSLSFLDKCLMSMRQDEQSQYCCTNSLANISPATLCIRVKYISKFPFFWDLSLEQIVERTTMFKEIGNSYFSSGNQLESALFNYSYSLKLLTLWCSFCKETHSSIDQLLQTLYLNLALCQLKSGGYDYVITNCSKALELKIPNSETENSTTVKALYRRGVAYFNIGKLDESLEDLKLATKLDPQNTAVSNQLSLVKKKIHEYDECLKEKLKQMF